MKGTQVTPLGIYPSEIESEKKTAKHIEEAPLSTGKERILFIDDEPHIGRLVKEMLESLGYTVVTKTNSLEALELFQEAPFLFDLVITDLNMPNLMGDELALKLMETRLNIPIIFCTGNSEFILEDKSKTVGVRDYILKPFGIGLLAETVRSALDCGLKRRPQVSQNMNLVSMLDPIRHPNRQYKGHTKGV
jgi:CheY-like chemotaxis protein